MIMISLIERRQPRLSELSWQRLNEQRCDLLAEALACRKPAEVRAYAARIELFNVEVRRRRGGFKRRIAG
jgi:hypothetical protein